MGTHIQEFVIHDYKGLHELKLSGLNSINILTGDNNSGKTSVLEILSTLDNPQNTGSWVLCSRMRNVNPRSRFYFNGFLNMFPIDSDTKTISYDYKDSKGKINKVALHAELEETQISEKEMYKLDGLRRIKSSKSEDEVIDTVCMYLSTYLNGNKINKDKIFDFQTVINKFISKHKSFVRTTYISPVDHAAGMLFLDDILSNSEMYSELIHVLQEFDKNILSVNALKSESSPYSAEYMILTQNHKKALPLNAYGDGMKKTLLLLSAAVRSQNGILLLDEFETAIHTSAMNSVFSWLLKSAIKLNVQVFLTSHSKEAIEKVMQCSTELQPYIHLYTLYHFEGKSYVRTMTSQEAIRAKDNLGLELR